MPVDVQRALHRAALADLDALVGQVGPGDLDRPTPCAGWDVADLLAHVVGQHLGFAAAARHGDAPREAYAPVGFDHDHYRASVDALLAAFADLDPDALVREVELAPTPLPASVVVGAQLLDTAVHAWDLARAVGQAYRPSPDVAEAVLAVAEPIPDDERRERPGSAFARALPLPDGEPAPGAAWDRVLTLLGRDPAWAPTVGG